MEPADSLRLLRLKHFDQSIEAEQTGDAARAIIRA
jgi:hypothetical protein